MLFDVVLVLDEFLQASGIGSFAQGPTLKAKVQQSIDSTFKELLAKTLKKRTAQKPLIAEIDHEQREIVQARMSMLQP